MTIQSADGLNVISDKEIAALYPKGESIAIDSFLPAYEQKCENCGNSPVVKGVFKNRIAYDGSMCGPCTWGEAATLDPETWNE